MPPTLQASSSGASEETEINARRLQAFTERVDGWSSVVCDALNGKYVTGQYERRNCIEVDGVCTESLLAKVSIQAGQNEGTASFEWNGSCWASSSITKYEIGTRNFISLSVKCGESADALLKIQQNMIDKVKGAMPQLFSKTPGSFLLRMEDGATTIISKSKTYTVVKFFRGAVTVAWMDNDNNHVKYSIQNMASFDFGNMSAPLPIRWVLEKDNHFYHIDHTKAGKVILRRLGFPEQKDIDAEERREQGLLCAFIMGTHHRVGASSVLSRYSSRDVMEPLVSFFRTGRV